MAGAERKFDPCRSLQPRSRQNQSHPDRSFANDRRTGLSAGPHRFLEEMLRYCGHEVLIGILVFVNKNDGKVLREQLSKFTLAEELRHETGNVVMTERDFFFINAKKTAVVLDRLCVDSPAFGDLLCRSAIASTSPRSAF